MLAAALLACPAHAGPADDSGFENVRFGATSADLLQHFGARATHLDRPLDFGDAYVDVVLRQYELGGYPFIVFFQMDRASGMLRRIQIERPRHGAVAMVHRAMLAALTARYGPPAQACTDPTPKVAGRAVDERIWRRAGVVVRAVFHEQSLGVLESHRLGIDDWLVWQRSLAGLPQQLLVRIAPAGTEPATCGAAP